MKKSSKLKVGTGTVGAGLCVGVKSNFQLGTLGSSWRVSRGITPTLGLLSSKVQSWRAKVQTIVRKVTFSDPLCLCVTLFFQATHKSFTLFRAQSRPIKQLFWATLLTKEVSMSGGSYSSASSQGFPPLDPHNLQHFRRPAPKKATARGENSQLLNSNIFKTRGPDCVAAKLSMAFAQELSSNFDCYYCILHPKKYYCQKAFAYDQTLETMTKMRAGVVSVIWKGSTGGMMTQQTMLKMRAGLVGVIAKGSTGGGLVVTKAGARRGWWL